MDEGDIFDFFIDKICEALEKRTFEEIRFWSGSACDHCGIYMKIPNLKGKPILITIPIEYSDSPVYSYNSVSKIEIADIQIWKHNLSFSRKRKFKRLEKLAIQAFLEERERKHTQAESEGQKHYENIIG
ncbi:MAG: hypothetical protein KAW45_05655 [Thermoplasmatales archaeon]|nr:hypothetical protein [Thermoplasmatales archaeon]